MVRLGDRVGIPWPHIATDLVSLDTEVLGIGGLPRGRIIEIVGPESSGKTTVALHVIAQEQKNGGLCVFVDAEHALEPSYASAIGVNVNDLIVSQPDFGEQALNTVEALIETNAVSLIVIDSVAALVPKAELDGDMGDSHMGLQARLMSQAMRKLNGKASKFNVTVIFINQIREKIGVMFGSPETTTGGRALKFYSSVRLDIRKIGGDVGKITQGTEVIGHKIKIRAIKNKMATPFKETIVGLIYGKGFDMDSDTIEQAIAVGVILKEGAWLKFKGKPYHRADLLEFITDIKDEILKKEQI